jgi:hypothetical protein
MMQISFCLELCVVKILYSVGAELDRVSLRPMPPITDCAVCGRWLLGLRPSMRRAIDRLPLDVDQVCDQCLLAFWANCARPKTNRA